MRLDKVISSNSAMSIAGKNVYFSSNIPSSPSDGDLWFEPGAIYPQPWTWDNTNSIWLAQSQNFITAYQTYAATTVHEFTVPFYNDSNPRIKVVQIAAFVAVVSTGTAHSVSNQYTFQLRSLRGNQTSQLEYTLTTDTGTNPSPMGLNGWRRILEYPNVFYPGIAWTMELSINKTGTPANINATFIIHYQLARP